MTQIYILECEIPTELFVIQRTFIVSTVTDAQGVREYVKSIGGKVRRHSIDHVLDYQLVKHEIDYEVRECNRVAGVA